MLTVAASIFSVSTVSLKMVQEKKSQGKKKKKKKKALVTYLKGGKQEGEAIKLPRTWKAPLTWCNI